MNTSHYPSLELCKKLTEAGFPRTTMFTQQSSRFSENWYPVMNTKTRDELFDHRCFENWSTTADMKKEIVYPSVMELLDKMPSWIIVNYKDGDIGNYKLEIGRQGTSESTDAYYVHYVEGTGAYSFMLGTLPNALAEMWLWLKENKYL